MRHTMDNSIPDIRRRFDWKTFILRVAVIAVPVALQNLMSVTGSMVDTMMIARLGETTVGAVGLCAQYSTLMLAAYWGFVGGGTLFISQYWGAQDDEGICRSYGLILTCIMSVAVIFGSLALFAPGFIMRLYTDKTVIQDVGISYLKIVGYAYPLQLFSVAASTLLRATEKVRIPMFAALTSVATNIFLNWVFIYGNLGFPAMGVRGAAIATVCAAGVNVLFILVACLIIRYRYIFRVRDHFRWVGSKVKEFFARCYPMIINEVFLGIGNMTINMVLGRQTEQTIAALAVFRTLEGLVISFFSGFSSASSVLVGKSVGAGELEEAYQKARRIIPLCVFTIAIAAVPINLLRPPFLRLMSLSGQSFEIAGYLIMVYSLVAILRMGNWCMNDTFRASGDAVTGTVLELIFMYSMVIPVVCIAGLKLRVSIYVLFPLVYCDEVIRFIIMTRHLHSGRFIRPVTDLGKAALPEFRKKRKLEKKHR